MDKIFEHIGQFDFWSIFGAGVITLTSSMFPFLTNIISILFCNDKNVSEILVIFIYIIISYILGLLLHSLSAFLTDIKIMRFGLHNSFKDCDEYEYKKDNYLYRIFKYFRYMRGKYIKFNPRIPKDDFFNDFYKCYSYLKKKKLTRRSDKYMAIYGMACSLSIGYFMLFIFSLIALMPCITINIHIVFIFLYATFSLLFYMRAKKYYFRWIECIFIYYNKNKQHQDNRKDYNSNK